MSGIKKYNSITSTSWDILKETLNKDLKRHYDYDEDFNLIFVEINKTYTIKRGFCKCGNSFNIKKDNKTNNDIIECPYCKNNNYFSLYYNGSTYDDFIANFFFEVHPNKIDLVRKAFSIREAVSETTLDIYQKEDVIASITSTDMKIYDKSFLRFFDFKEFLNVLKFKYPYLDVFLNTISIKEMDFIIFSKFLNAINKYPNLMSSIEEYPTLISSIVMTKSIDIDDTTTIDDIFKNFIECPNNLKNGMKSLFNKMHVYDICSQYGDYSKPGFLKNRLNVFEKYKSIQTNELKNSIEYLVYHSSLTASDIRLILGNINYFKFSKEEEQILAKYILSNHIVHGYRVVDNFYQNISFLKNKKLLVSEENLEKRNFNLLKNMVYLKELGYNEEKVSYFLDSFELNPLSSIQHLSTKRAPTIQMKKELEEKMDKKYT